MSTCQELICSLDLRALCKIASFNSVENAKKFSVSAAIVMVVDEYKVHVLKTTKSNTSSRSQLESSPACSV